jgi:type I restriction enzyme, S subunit
MTKEKNIIQLPKDWKWMKLGEVCNIQTGKYDANHAKSKGKYRFYTCAYDFLYCDTNRFKGESLILPGNGANVGEVFYYNGEFDAYQRTYVLNDIKTDSKYLFYHLLCNWRRRNQDKQFGSATNYIRMGNFTDYELPIPPKPTQQAIVTKIEELFSELDKGIENLRTAQQQLKMYRQSVLSAGTCGMLTGTNNNYLNSITIGHPKKLTKCWKVVKLTDVSKLESGHTPRKDTPAYWENGNVLWLSLQDIRGLDGKIATNTKYKTNKLGIENSSARLLPEGTVCFCRDISVGYVTIMGKVMSTTQHFANWICSSELNNKFLMYSFMASRDSLIRQGQGTTVKTIYMPDLKEMRIQLPSIKEQNKIVQQIESRLSVADKMEESIMQSLQQAEALKQSILKKAFEGKLKNN